MARLPRLVLPGHAHYVIQRAHGALAQCGVFADDIDRNAYLSALREATTLEQVQVHAYAMLASEVHLLLTPSTAFALGRTVQALARSYSVAHNRRHAHRGSLWDGRYRCAVLEAGTARADALRLIDGLSAHPGVTSALHRTSGERQPLLTDPPEYWALGNTPFEREAVYAVVLRDGIDVQRASEIRAAVVGGWAIGSPAFKARVSVALQRPAQPRARGRPRRNVDIVRS